ncbi:hypothetical protein BH11ACT5_BH11ACT5_07700 [soil metagenome]
MRRRKLDTIAKHWWATTYDGHVYSCYDDRRIDELARRPHTLIPLLRAAVRTVRGPFGLSYIGTSFVESMIMHFEFEKAPDKTIEILAATGLRGDTLTEILSGVWPEMLRGIGAEERLRGLVSDRQRSWLVDGTRHIGPPLL